MNHVMAEGANKYFSEDGDHEVEISQDELMPERRTDCDGIKEI